MDLEFPIKFNSRYNFAHPNTAETKWAKANNGSGGSCRKHLRASRMADKTVLS
jgi:hypothetical protein